MLRIVFADARACAAGRCLTTASRRGMRHATTEGAERGVEGISMRLRRIARAPNSTCGQHQQTHRDEPERLASDPAATPAGVAPAPWRRTGSGCLRARRRCGFWRGSSATGSLGCRQAQSSLPALRQARGRRRRCAGARRAGAPAGLQARQFRIAQFEQAARLGQFGFQLAHAVAQRLGSRRRCRRHRRYRRQQPEAPAAAADRCQIPRRRGPRLQAADCRRTSGRPRPDPRPQPRHRPAGAARRRREAG